MKKVLEESEAGALEVEVVNFIQRRAQTQASPDALLHMTRRAPDPAGPLRKAKELFESRKHAFVELMTYPKWISRARASTEIAMGDHGVQGVPEPRVKTDEIICLHAPLRARSTWFSKAVDQGARVRELDLTPGDWWQARRWYELATLGELEPEWRANSYADDRLDVYGVSHEVVFDPRLRDLVKPWINAQSSGNREETKVASDASEDQETKGTEGGDSSLATLAEADVSGAQKATATVPGPAAQFTPAVSEEQLVLAAGLTSSEDSIVQLIASDKRVLVVGHSVGSLSHAIHGRGCQVVVIETDRGAALGAWDYVERVVVGDVERLNLFQELKPQSFECVVLAGLLEFVKEPLVLLKTLKKYLRPDGSFLTSVSNVAHGALRIKLLQEGRLPTTEDDRATPRPLHSYTRETLEEPLEQAGFALGRLDRCELPIECSDVNQDHSAVPPKLLANLSQDADARTTHFVALAYPLPHPHLDLLQKRMRELAEQNDAARRESAEQNEAAQGELAALRPLPQRVTKMEGEIAHLRDSLKSEKADRQAALQELAEASTRVETRNKSLSKTVRRSKSRVRSLESELQETLSRLDGLRRENASLAETLGRSEKDRAALQDRANELSEECQAISRDLEAVHTSPGWKLISSYRDWLQNRVWTKPWLRKAYETVVQGMLGGGDSRRS